MKKYIFMHILRSIVSIFLVTTLTYAIIYTIVPRRLIFKQDPNYNKIATNKDKKANYENTIISLSAKTGEGLELLKEEILAIATGNGSLDAGLNVTARQLDEIRQALNAMTEAEAAILDGVGQDVDRRAHV